MSKDKTVSRVELDKDPSVVAFMHFNKNGDSEMCSPFYIGGGAEAGTNTNDIQAGLNDGTYIGFLNPYKSGKGHLLVVKARNAKAGNRYTAM